jgi:hypothetical protein
MTVKRPRNFLTITMDTRRFGAVFPVWREKVMAMFARKNHLARMKMKYFFKNKC